MAKTDETSIRLDVINFCAAVTNGPLSDHSLLAIIERGLADSFYKIVSESFRVLSLLVAKGVKPTAVINQLTLEKLRVADIDQEVKDAAIGAVGTLAARDEFTPAELDQVGL